MYRIKRFKSTTVLGYGIIKNERIIGIHGYNEWFTDKILTEE